MKHRLAFRANDIPQASDEAWVPLDVESLLALEQAGARTLVPPTLYDIEASNRIALEIYHALLDAFAECDALLAQAGASKYLNLVAIFFHEMQRIVCAYCYKRCELDYITSHYDVVLPDAAASASFPYPDYDFALNPALPPQPASLAPRRHLLNPRQVAREILERLSQLISSPGARRRLVCAPNLASDLRQIAHSLNASADGGRWDVRLLRPRQMSIALPHFDSQLLVLKSHISSLGKRLGIAMPESLFRIVELWIRAHLSERRASSWKADVLLVGSLLEPRTRMAAARAKSEGIPVASVFHGEACGVHDEPIFGYGENTFVDVVVGYGETGCRLAVEGEFSDSLFKDTVAYIPSASDKARRLYTQGPIATLSELESPRFMYLPTSFIGSGRYGPYRDMHDVAYLEWQRGLMCCAGEMFAGRVIWKRHAKDRIGIQSLTIPGVTILSKQFFEEVLDTADVFIFDYISSAFTLAAATNKPIIYLDIGLRNLSARAMGDIRERCVYLRADPRQPQEALRLALELADKRCVNRYTADFSLPADLRPRHEVIAGVICDLARQGLVAETPMSL